MNLKTCVLICLCCSALSYGLPTPVSPKAKSISAPHEPHLGVNHESTNAHSPWHDAFTQEEINYLHGLFQDPPHSTQQQHPVRSPQHSNAYQHHDEGWVDSLLVNHPSSPQTEAHNHGRVPLAPSSPSIVEGHHAHSATSSSPIRASPPLARFQSRQSLNVITKKSKPIPCKASVSFKRKTSGTGGNAVRYGEHEWQAHFKTPQMDQIYGNVAKHWRQDLPRRTLSPAITRLRGMLNHQDAKKILDGHEPTALHYAAQAAPPGLGHIDFKVGENGSKIPETKIELDRHYLARLKERANEDPLKQKHESVSKNIWPPPNLSEEQAKTITKQLKEHWSKHDEEGKVPLKSIDNTTRGRLRAHFRPELTTDLLSHKDSPEFKQAAKYLEAQTVNGYPAYMEQVNLAKRIRSRQS